MKVSHRNLILSIILDHNKSDQVPLVVASAALRLYPQVPMNTRSTIKTTLLPKVVVRMAKLQSLSLGKPASHSAHITCIAAKSFLVKMPMNTDRSGG
jgi:hypothetical protein